MQKKHQQHLQEMEDGGLDSSEEEYAIGGNANDNGFSSDDGAQIA